MTFDVEEALRLYPLPEGIDDAVVNRGQCASALRVSENIVSKYLDQGMPVLSRGSNGQAYEFQLSECFAWKMWRDAEQRRKRDEGDRAAAQMALLFRNDDEEDPNGPVMTADQIAAEADAAYRKARADELRGELVRAHRMRALLEDLLVMFRGSIMTIPDFAEMQFGLVPDQVQALQDRCDQVLIQARAEIDRVLVAPKGEVEQLPGASGQAG